MYLIFRALTDQQSSHFISIYLSGQKIEFEIVDVLSIFAKKKYKIHNQNSFSSFSLNYTYFEFPTFPQIVLYCGAIYWFNIKVSNKKPVYNQLNNAPF